MKTCTRCLKSKSLEEFAKLARSKDGRSSWCKECFSENARLKFQNDPLERERKRGNRNSFKTKNQEKVLAYLQSHPCVDCGTTDVRVLEFDHIDPTSKKFEISAKYWTLSWSNLLVEIEKCEVRCANCHRIRTWEQRGSWRSLL